MQVTAKEEFAALARKFDEYDNFLQETPTVHSSAECPFVVQQEAIATYLRALKTLCDKDPNTPVWGFVATSTTNP